MYPADRAHSDLFRYADGEPSLSFLIYGPVSWSTTVYQRMDSAVTELLVRPDPSPAVIVRGYTGRSQRLTGASAAGSVAGTLSRDLRLGRARARYERDLDGARHFDTRPASLYVWSGDGWTSLP